MKQWFYKESDGAAVDRPNWAAVVLAITAALNLAVSVVNSVRGKDGERVVVEVRR